MEEMYDRHAVSRYVNAHLDWLTEQGNELELYYKKPNIFNYKTNSLMSFTHEIIDNQIEKIKNDPSVPEKSKQRRIALWEDMRPETPAVESNVEADIKAWGVGNLKASKGLSDNSLKSVNPSADIKEWAKAHNQTTK